jgi:hypothetical protein
LWAFPDSQGSRSQGDKVGEGGAANRPGPRRAGRWRACTDPDELAEWFFTPTGTNEGEARFDLFGTEVAWTILELDPPRRLRYRQSGGTVPRLPGPIETSGRARD